MAFGDLSNHVEKPQSLEENILTLCGYCFDRQHLVINLTYCQGKDSRCGSCRPNCSGFLCISRNAGG